MKMRKTLLSLSGLLLAGGAAAVVYAQAGDLSLLQTLERGQWQLRAVGNSSPAAVSQICLRDPRSLVQIQHGLSSCSYYVVRATSNSVTVSYSCNGAGQGLTTIRRESGSLVQIQSQGIRNNAPFNFSVEARRSGSC